jgi:hypothetical protein
MKDWRGHKHGEYDDECPICWFDRELDKAEDELDAKDARIAQLEVVVKAARDWLEICGCCADGDYSIHDGERICDRVGIKAALEELDK